MTNKNYLSISSFARLTGIKRANLIFYDKIGLLTPEFRGENEYRYYSRRQLDSAFLITNLRELGIGLAQIKAYAQNRSPEQMLLLFEQQEAHILQEMAKLKSLHEIMRLHTDAAKTALGISTDSILLETKSSVPIQVGECISPSQSEEDGMLFFYQKMTDQNMAIGYPLGTIVSRDSLYPGSTYPVSRYYFLLKSGGNCVKPKGLYVTIHGSCPYGQAAPFYELLYEYVEKNKLCISGDAYEEYPLNELSMPDEERYRVKIEIPVTLKE